MKQLSISIIALVLAVSANAETVSLVCEHDPGTHARNGELLDSDDYMTMFRLDIDTHSMIAKASVGVWSQTDIKIGTASGADQPIVFFSLKIKRDEKSVEYISYILNRITGTLFARIRFSAERTADYYVAAGQCVNANGKALF